MTHHCAGCASGPQKRRHVHRMSGSKSSSASDGSSKVVTAHRAKGCDTSYKKEFQIRAEVTLKSKKMGVVKSDNVTLPCNFKVK